MCQVATNTSTVPIALEAFILHIDGRFELQLLLAKRNAADP